MGGGEKEEKSAWKREKRVRVDRGEKWRMFAYTKRGRRGHIKVIETVVRIPCSCTIYDGHKIVECKKIVIFPKMYTCSMSKCCVMIYVRCLGNNMPSNGNTYNLTTVHMLV